MKMTNKTVDNHKENKTISDNESIFTLLSFTDADSQKQLYIMLLQQSYVYSFLFHVTTCAGYHRLYSCTVNHTSG